MCYLNFFEHSLLFYQILKELFKKADHQITTNIEKFYSSVAIIHNSLRRTQMLENEGEDMSTKLLTSAHSF